MTHPQPAGLTAGEMLRDDRIPRPLHSPDSTTDDGPFTAAIPTRSATPSTQRAPRPRWPEPTPSPHPPASPISPPRADTKPTASASENTPRHMSRRQLTHRMPDTKSGPHPTTPTTETTPPRTRTTPRCVNCVHPRVPITTPRPSNTDRPIERTRTPQPTPRANTGKPRDKPTTHPDPLRTLTREHTPPPRRPPTPDQRRHTGRPRPDDRKPATVHRGPTAHHRTVLQHGTVSHQRTRHIRRRQIRLSNPRTSRQPLRLRRQGFSTTRRHHPRHRRNRLRLDRPIPSAPADRRPARGSHARWCR